MTAALVGPVEGTACPGCAMVPLIEKPDLECLPWRARAALQDLYDGHFIGCPTIGTCGQFGPPWPTPRHREADFIVGEWTPAKSRAHVRRAHLRPAS